MCKCSKGFQIQERMHPLIIIGCDQRWQNISIDFVTGIPAVKDANGICNIVDCLSKKRHYIATDKKIDTKRLADLFMYHV